MVYQKNLPMGERVLRVLAGIAVIAATLLPPLFTLLAGWLQGLIIASAAAFVFFGFIGFCPACALYGRKPHGKK